MSMSFCRTALVDVISTSERGHGVASEKVGTGDCCVLSMDAAEELAAEEWGSKIASIHAFNTKRVTMGYDNRPEEGSVMDIVYNNGRIQRTLSTGRVIWMGEPLSKKTLLNYFSSAMEDIRNGIR